MSEINPAYKGTLELPGELYERLQAYVTKRRSTLKAVVIEAVARFLDEASGDVPASAPPAMLQKLTARMVELLDTATVQDLRKMEVYLDIQREVRQKQVKA